MDYKDIQKMKDVKVSELTVGELDDIIYRANVSANHRLFKGILPFLRSIEDQLYSITDEIEYLKSTSNFKAHKKLESQLSMREQQIKEVVALLNKNEQVLPVGSEKGNGEEIL